MTAVEKEFSITLTPIHVQPRDVHVQRREPGSFPHNLTIKGPAIDSQATPTIEGGETAQLTVTFQKASYELWCSVDSHKDQGMDVDIDVS